MEKGASQCIRVKCGSKEAEFYPQKCRKSGKTIANCIKYNGRWLNLLEFESLYMVENGEKTSSMKENLLVNGLLSKIVTLVLKGV